MYFQLLFERSEGEFFGKSVETRGGRRQLRSYLWILGARARHLSEVHHSAREGTLPRRNLEVVLATDVGEEVHFL